MHHSFIVDKMRSVHIVDGDTSDHKHVTYIQLEVHVLNTHDTHVLSMLFQVVHSDGDAARRCEFTFLIYTNPLRSQIALFRLRNARLLVREGWKE